MNLRWEVSWRKKICGISPEKMQDGGALLEEEVDVTSSWLREDSDGKEERPKKFSREEEEVS